MHSERKLSDNLRPKIWIAEQMNNLANTFSLGMGSLAIIAKDMHTKINSKLNALREEADKMDKTIITTIPLKDRFEPSDAYLKGICNGITLETIERIIDKMMHDVDESESEDDEDEPYQYEFDSDL
mgnify:CR=1 FL=1